MLNGCLQAGGGMGYKMKHKANMPFCLVEIDWCKYNIANIKNEIAYNRICDILGHSLHWIFSYVNNTNQNRIADHSKFQTTYVSIDYIMLMSAMTTYKEFENKYMCLHNDIKQYQQYHAQCVSTPTVYAIVWL